MRLEPQLVALKVAPGGYMESQSGLQRSNPQIYCRYFPAADRRLAFIIFHPTSNFHGHYLMEPVARKGAAILALNTRYIGNDSMLLMERALQDVSAGMRFLRNEGYRKIVMIGNSGGGSLAAYYQEQATRVTVASTPDGRAFALEQSELPPADSIALIAAHPGRAEQLAAKIDPSVRDESEFPEVDRSLDMFEASNGPEYDAAWLAHYRDAQKARLGRIEAWVASRISELDATRPPETADDAFIVRRTQADPRTLDLTIDSNDRAVGTLGGAARLYNEAANGLARFCTLRSFLSQWSPSHSRAYGPGCLANTSVPVLIVNYTADQTVFPSHVDAWAKAAGRRATGLDIKGAPHYLSSQADMVERVVASLMDWGG